jgi:hypothetical protein
VERDGGVRLRGIDHHAGEWPAWRLWTEDKATLEALDTHYSLADVAAMNEILDALEEARSRNNGRR